MRQVGFRLSHFCLCATCVTTNPKDLIGLLRGQGGVSAPLAHLHEGARAVVPELGFDGLMASSLGC